MAEQGISRANENRRIRQEALREQLEAGGHIQHVVDIAGQLSDLSKELESGEVQRLKNAADIKLSLLKKYLPDLKSVDIVADVDHSGDLHITWQAP